MSDLFFNLLLFDLNFLLKSLFTLASLRNPSFRKKLEKNQFTLLIKTRDGGNARFFKLTGGRMASRREDYLDPDMSLVWSETRAFNSILFNLNPMRMMQGLMEALQADKLVIEADLDATRWFMSMVGEMLLVYRYFFSFKRD